MDAHIFTEVNQKLKERISKRQKLHILDNTRIPSAVLIPIYFSRGEYYIVFTRRTELVSYHKGEISFPGGGFHQADGSLLNTALRESFEEIGLSPNEVLILGELDDMLTRGSNFIITPFVGSILPEHEFTLSHFETAEIIEVPVSALLENGCRREEPVIVLGSQSITPYVYAYQGKLITGATARILKQFLDIFLEASG